MNNELQNSSISNMNCGDGGCGTITTGFYQYWPYPQQTYNPNYYPHIQYISTTAAPTECCGDVHVFPCAKCGDCKCGKAKLAKGRK